MSLVGDRNEGKGQFIIKRTYCDATRTELRGRRGKEEKGVSGWASIKA